MNRGARTRLQYDAAMTEVLLIAITAGAVISLLVAARSGERDLEVLSKTFASATFVVLGATRWSPGDPVGLWILVGLVLCAVGDVLLLWQRSFDAGVGAFLAGHLAYIAAFAVAVPITDWPVLPAGPVLLSSLGAVSWLWPHAARRRLTVVAYVAVITIMVWGALATGLSPSMSWTAAAGGILFYLSDLAVARNRFVRAEFANRAVGLPLYYSGQILIALAIGA
jgi:uncharacterized membrane protein YhhN